MAEHNSVNVKYSSSQLDKLKSVLKIAEKVILRLSSNRIDSFSDKFIFPNKLLLTDTQEGSLWKDFEGKFVC